MVDNTLIEMKLKKLEEHLEKENPVLSGIVKSFRELDTVAHQIGFLDENESYTSRVSWWPMISVLGTFSSGKSTFINYHLGKTIQRTGNQAVDDKFTVICYSGDEQTNALPGMALDSDPRFPFYQVSRDVEEIARSGGQRIDSYLQLKTASSEKLRGKILIDSPGFDADKQRTATLGIAKHIIDLSDLVLVFFDARHPEPGAMHDTLEHLVAATIDRADSNKFLYILNQIDITAREDNPEEVVAAWQRSLAQVGLTAGRFYRIYNPDVCMPIDDPNVKERYESKRDADMHDINTRMEQVSTERAYRIVGVLEQAAKDIEFTMIPQLKGWLQRWKQSVLKLDVAVLFALLVAFVIAQQVSGVDFIGMIPKDDVGMGVSAAIAVIALGFIHMKIRGFVAARLRKTIEENTKDEFVRGCLLRAFDKNTSTRPMIFSNPAGWGTGARTGLRNILNTANSYVQKLNDRFTNPSGKKMVETEV